MVGVVGGREEVTKIFYIIMCRSGGDENFRGGLLLVGEGSEVLVLGDVF